MSQTSHKASLARKTSASTKAGSTIKTGSPAKAAKTTRASSTAKASTSAKTGSSSKVAYLFTDKGPSTPAVLGGKGAGLVELASKGVPVPPGFTITTAVARAYIQHRRTPKRLARQNQLCLARLEQGKRFGDPVNPLLLSVRSGAEVSMPGMMDTVLNLGLNPEIAAGFGRLHGERFALDCYRRFLAMFGDVVLGLKRSDFEAILGDTKRQFGVTEDSALTAHALAKVVQAYRNHIADSGAALVMLDNPQNQLTMAIEAVLSSWDNPRAQQYRRANGIADNLGTAVTVQTMVFGNADDNSATGVVFSRNVASGQPGLWGEYLVNAQGEDVVAGSRTPMPIAGMAKWNAALFAQLKSIVEMLERQRGHVVDVEFTVESGNLYILQVRKAKVTPEAAVTMAVHSVWDKRLSKDAALASVTPEQLAVVQAQGFAPDALQEAISTRLLSRGLSASPGTAVGAVVRSSQEAVRAKARGERVILVRPDTSPDDLPGMLAACAIVTECGGATSHAAIVARDMGKPCVVGCTPFAVRDGDIISVDGKAGVIISGAMPSAQTMQKKEVNLFLRWKALAEAASWPKPRLVFEDFERSVTAFQLLNDFYLSDSMAVEAVGTPHESKAKTLRTKTHIRVAETLAMYLVVAIGGEIRHAKGRNMFDCKAELDTLVKEFGVKLDCNDRAEAQRQPVEALRKMSHEDHIRFARLVAGVFQKGEWSSAYGGKPWAQIARAACQFLTGELSHTRFADHAFDLQHNNGSVFGKHPMINVQTLWSNDRHKLYCALETKKRAKTFGVLKEALFGYSKDCSVAVRALADRLAPPQGEDDSLPSVEAQALLAALDQKEDSGKTIDELLDEPLAGLSPITNKGDGWFEAILPMTTNAASYLLDPLLAGDPHDSVNAHLWQKKV